MRFYSGLNGDEMRTGWADQRAPERWFLVWYQTAVAHESYVMTVPIRQCKYKTLQQVTARNSGAVDGAYTMRYERTSRPAVTIVSVRCGGLRPSEGSGADHRSVVRSTPGIAPDGGIVSQRVDIGCCTAPYSGRVGSATHQEHARTGSTGSVLNRTSKDGCRSGDPPQDGEFYK